MAVVNVADDFFQGVAHLCDTTTSVSAHLADGDEHEELWRRGLLALSSYSAFVASEGSRRWSFKQVKADRRGGERALIGRDRPGLSPSKRRARVALAEGSHSF